MQGQGGHFGTVRTIVLPLVVVFIRRLNISGPLRWYETVCVSQATLRIKNIYVIKEANLFFFLFFLQNKSRTALKSLLK